MLENLTGLGFWSLLILSHAFGAVGEILLAFAADAPNDRSTEDGREDRT